MATLQLKIDKCSECPHCKITRLYTGDSWEHAEDYWCKATPDVPKNERGRSALPFKLISGYVEWNDEIPSPPEWCPFLDDVSKNQIRLEKANKELKRIEKQILEIIKLGGLPSPALEEQMLALKSEIKKLGEQ